MTGDLERLRLLHDLGAAFAGNPDVGRELGTLLDAAGFEDVFFTLGVEQPERPEERLQISRLNEPGPIWAVPFGEATGRKRRASQIATPRQASALSTAPSAPA